MKLVFISNFFNHHQKSISDFFYKNVESFFFVSTSSVPKERKELGYVEESEPYLLHFDINQPTPKEIDDADVYICSCYKGFAKEIITKKKKVFIYTERINKKKSALKELYHYFSLRFLSINPNIYLLSAGAFVGNDFRNLGLFTDKMYKWGYFPPTEQYDINEIMINKNYSHIVWCGRLINWKHPEKIISLGLQLRKNHIDFHINVIGTGRMYAYLKKSIIKNKLSDNVSMLGPMSPSCVREEMEKAGIFISTSDRNEGWGAVVNEAMNSCCAVIASDLIGSVPFLIKPNENGLVYKFSSDKDLFDKTIYLLENKKIQRDLGISAYKTIINNWNGEIAGARFIKIASHLNNDGDYLQCFSGGPCSKDDCLKDNWFDYEK